LGVSGDYSRYYNCYGYCFPVGEEMEMHSNGGVTIEMLQARAFVRGGGKVKSVIKLVGEI